MLHEHLQWLMYIFIFFGIWKIYVFKFVSNLLPYFIRTRFFHYVFFPYQIVFVFIFVLKLCYYGVSANEDHLDKNQTDDKYCNLWFSIVSFTMLPLKGDVGDNGYFRVGLILLDIGEILDPILVCGWDILSTSIPLFRISWISHQLYKCIVCECNWEIRNIIHVY